MTIMLLAPASGANSQLTFATEEIQCLTRMKPATEHHGSVPQLGHFTDRKTRVLHRSSC